MVSAAPHVLPAPPEPGQMTMRYASVRMAFMHLTWCGLIWTPLSGSIIGVGVGSASYGRGDCSLDALEQFRHPITVCKFPG